MATEKSFIVEELDPNKKMKISTCQIFKLV